MLDPNVAVTEQMQSICVNVPIHDCKQSLLAR